MGAVGRVVGGGVRKPHVPRVCAHEEEGSLVKDQLLPVHLLKLIFYFVYFVYLFYILVCAHEEEGSLVKDQLLPVYLLKLIFYFVYLFYILVCAHEEEGPLVEDQLLPVHFFFFSLSNIVMGPGGQIGGRGTLCGPPMRGETERKRARRRKKVGVKK